VEKNSNEKFQNLYSFFSDGTVITSREMRLESHVRRIEQEINAKF
jgi:hypothetical protein